METATREVGRQATVGNENSGKWFTIDMLIRDGTSKKKKNTNPNVVNKKTKH